MGVTLGETIKELRKKKKITINNLSKLSGIGYNTLRSIEAGRIEYPNSFTLCKIAEVLGTPPSLLYDNIADTISIDNLGDIFNKNILLDGTLLDNEEKIILQDIFMQGFKTIRLLRQCNLNS